MKDLQVRLTVDQADCLQWLAASFPKGFRDIAKSTTWQSLVRKGFASWQVTEASRPLLKGPAARLRDYHLTAKGLTALRDVNPELWARVDAIIEDEILRQGKKWPS